MNELTKKMKEFWESIKTDPSLKDEISFYGDDEIKKVPKLKTGFYTLDDKLDGGVPLGRMIEIFGPEAGGKTTLALHLVAACQKQGGACCFIDVENSLDPIYAKNIGVDVNNLMLAQPSSGEVAFDITTKLLIKHDFDMIVFDSVAALVSQEELDKDMSDSERVGAQGKLMSRGLRKIVGTQNAKKDKKTIFVFINQLRDQIGGWSPVKLETTPGGRALKFFSSVRFDVRKVSGKAEDVEISEGGEAVARKTRVRIVKNKTGKLGGVELWIDCSGRGTGFRADLELKEAAVGRNIINNFKIDPKTGERLEGDGRKYYFVRKDGTFILVANSQAELNDRFQTNPLFLVDVKDSLEELEPIHVKVGAKIKVVAFEEIYSAPKTENNVDDDDDKLIEYKIDGTEPVDEKPKRSRNKKEESEST